MGNSASNLQDELELAMALSRQEFIRAMRDSEGEPGPSTTKNHPPTSIMTSNSELDAFREEFFAELGAKNNHLRFTGFPSNVQANTQLSERINHRNANRNMGIQESLALDMQTFWEEEFLFENSLEVSVEKQEDARSQRYLVLILVWTIHTNVTKATKTALLLQFQTSQV